jgi:hypothetical protein
MWVALALSSLLLAAGTVTHWWSIDLGGPRGTHIGIRDGTLGLGASHAFPRWSVTVERAGGPIETRPYWYAQSSLAVPLWACVLASVAMCVLAYWMSRSKPPGRCAKCGYDLTGLSPGAGGALVCPECGKAAAAKGTA